MNERKVRVEIEVHGFNMENGDPPNVSELKPNGYQTLITSVWMTKKEEWEGLINGLGNRVAVNENCRMSIIIDLSEWQGEHTKKLSHILFSKNELLTKVLESQKERSTIIMINSEQLTFKDINATLDAEMLTAYIMLGQFMCEMAMNLKRANATQKVVENDRYAFRTWLLRMGMIGDEYKSIRKCLLQKLEGNSAFKQPK